MPGSLALHQWYLLYGKALLGAGCQDKPVLDTARSCRVTLEVPARVVSSLVWGEALSPFYAHIHAPKEVSEGFSWPRMAAQKP